MRGGGAGELCLPVAELPQAVLNRDMSYTAVRDERCLTHGCLVLTNRGRTMGRTVLVRTVADASWSEHWRLQLVDEGGWREVKSGADMRVCPCATADGLPLWTDGCGICATTLRINMSARTARDAPRAAHDPGH